MCSSSSVLLRCCLGPSLDFLRTQHRLFIRSYLVQSSTLQQSNFTRRIAKHQLKSMAEIAPSTPLFSAGCEIAAFLVSNGLLSKAWEVSARECASFPGSFLVSEDEDEDGNVYFAFPSSPKPEDLVIRDSGYGECNIWSGNSFFGSLKGSDDQPAHVHEGALKHFLHILKSSDLKHKIEAAQKKGKNIVCVGHSLGGAIAALATLWILEKWAIRSSALCITFGSPLVGDATLVQAVDREKWGGRFYHVVSISDIVPRLLLAPFDSIREPVTAIWPHLWSGMTNNSSANGLNPLAESAWRTLLANVRGYSSALVNYGRTCISGSEDVAKRSPYRPFGAYIFCSNTDAVCFENPETALQMLHFTIQSQGDISGACISEHTGYGAMLHNINRSFLNTRRNAYPNLDSSYKVGIALQLGALGIGPQNDSAQLALWKAGENENSLNTNIAKITDDLRTAQSAMAEIEWYKWRCEKDGIGYYDTFKLQKEKRDMRANILRGKLEDFWKGIIEKVEKHELPSDFQSQNKWINAGTAYRKLVEPLDIADYYRHGNQSYLSDGRPLYYTVLQKWMEEKEKTRNIREKKARTKPASLTMDSCFWAHVEEARQSLLNLKTENLESFQEYVMKMIDDHSLSSDVFLGQSSFISWWQDYEQSSLCKSDSPLYQFMQSEGWISYSMVS